MNAMTFSLITVQETQVRDLALGERYLCVHTIKKGLEQRVFTAVAHFEPVWYARFNKKEEKKQKTLITGKI